MENQIAVQERQAEIQRKKNLIGRKGDSSKPFNIINQNYEQNEVGEMFKIREQENEMRRDARSKRMMMIGDSAFNIINGSDRPNISGFLKPYNSPIDSV